MENKISYVVRVWPCVMKLQKTRLMEIVPTDGALRYSQRL